MREYKQDVFWGNIPYGKNRFESRLGFLKITLGKESFLKNIKNPYFIWTGTGRIFPLESMTFHPNKQRELQKQEIYFYLYEPICARIGNYNKSFYSEFNSEDNLNNIICDEIESIKLFVKNNNIKHYRIFTADYNIQLIKNNYPGIKIDCLDLFLRDAVRLYIKPLKITNDITNKFWCGNWRYTTHRHLIMSYICKLSGTYTWNLNCSLDELSKNVWFNIEKLKSENLNRYTQLLDGVKYLIENKFSIDQNINALVVNNSSDVFIPGDNAPKSTDKFLSSYKNSFCAIINETRFAQPFGNISEKTLAPIYSKLPFILVAPPYTLEYLKTFGFKTFDKWWDESYDLEENHYKRIIKIFEVIDYINSKPIDELKIIYNEMEEILLNNQEVLRSIAFNDKIL